MRKEREQFQHFSGEKPRKFLRNEVWQQDQKTSSELLRSEFWQQEQKIASKFHRSEVWQQVEAQQKALKGGENREM